MPLRSLEQAGQIDLSKNVSNEKHQQSQVIGDNSTGEVELEIDSPAEEAISLDDLLAQALVAIKELDEEERQSGEVQSHGVRLDKVSWTSSIKKYEEQLAEKGDALPQLIVSSSQLMSTVSGALLASCGGIACLFHGHGLASAASSVGNVGGGLSPGLGVPGFGGLKGGGAGYSPDASLQWLADNSGYSPRDIASGKVSLGELASALEHIFGPIFGLTLMGQFLNDLWDGFMPRTNSQTAYRQAA